MRRIRILIVGLLAVLVTVFGIQPAVASVAVGAPPHAPSPGLGVSVDSSVFSSSSGRKSIHEGQFRRVVRDGESYVTAYAPKLIERSDLAADRGATVKFDLPSLCVSGGSRSGLRCGNMQGAYSIYAADSHGNLIDYSERANGTELSVEISPRRDATYPLMVSAFIGEASQKSEASRIALDSAGAMSDPANSAGETVGDASSMQYIGDRENSGPRFGNIESHSVNSASLSVMNEAAEWEVTIPEDYVYCAEDEECPERWLHDYCTSSVDSPGIPYTGFYVDFRGPCARHDMAFEEIYASNSSKADKRSRLREANSEFKANLDSQCWFSAGSLGYVNPAYWGCRAIAAVYYVAVQTSVSFKSDSEL